MKWLVNLIDYIGIGLLCLIVLEFIITIMMIIYATNEDIEQKEKISGIDIYRFFKYSLLAVFWMILQGGGYALFGLYSVIYSIKTTFCRLKAFNLQNNQNQRC